MNAQLKPSETEFATIAEAKEVIRNLEKMHELVLNHNRELQNKLQTARENNDTLRERLRTSLESDIEYPVSARKCFKAGRLDDGFYELDRALSDFDHSWRTRA